MKKTTFISLALCLPFLGLAQKDLDIKSVSIFKNQSAFFVKNGKVKAKNKTWAINGDTIPPALNGTLWLSSPSNDFEMVKAYKKELEEKKEAVAEDFGSMLSLNNEKTVTLYFADTSYTGTVMLMQTATTKKDAPAKRLNAPLFALKMANGKTMIFTKNRINSLTNIEFGQTPNFVYDYKQKKTTPTLQIDFKSNKVEQEINMMYLSKGLAWKPDYLIELTEENKAKLTLRSTVINDAEDIETDKLNLVAGVPNFKYATSISDLIKSLKIKSLTNNTYETIPQTFRNTANSEGAVYDFVRPTTNNNTSNTTNAAAMEDLYFYTLKNIVLKKRRTCFL